MKNIYTQKVGSFLFFCFLSFFSFNGFAQVGIGTTEPKTALDVNGALSLREGAAINTTGNPGNLNNISLGTTPYSFYRITSTSTSNFDLTGIIPVAGADGQMVTLINTRAGAMTIRHNSNSSTNANRIYVPGEKDLQLRGRYTAITLQYSKEFQRWVLLNKLNHIETWRFSKSFVSGTQTYIEIIPQATAESSVNVNFGNIASNRRNNLYIEYVESQDGQVVYRVRNTRGSSISGDIIVTINKI